jgi:hypothetical protein
MAITYIVAMRNPASGKLHFLMEDDEHVAEFATEEVAYSVAEGHRMARAWGAEIVPLAGAVAATESPLLNRQ